MTAPPTTIDPPFRLTGTPGRSPIVLASPHSGRDYPAAFLAQSRLAVAQLRRAEDAYVDELLKQAAAAGAPLIAARFGRAYLDLNRAAAELDPTMIAEPLHPDATQPTERVAAGLGVLPRIAAHGLDIYAARLRLADAQSRIATVHLPYHAALRALIRKARAAHGYAVLLDCHSMPTPPSGPDGAPQFVLGDLHGQSAAPALVHAIERQLREAGFRVARNNPYAGGYTTAHHADVPGGVHVVQIEIDRALYMDPARLAPHGGFAQVTETLGHLVRALVTLTPLLDLGPQRMAAE